MPGFIILLLAHIPNLQILQHRHNHGQYFIISIIIKYH